MVSNNLPSKHSTRCIVADSKPGGAMVTAEEVSIEEAIEDHTRTFHDTGAAYVLPNDHAEHERLEVQHKLFRDLMGGITFHAPVDETKIRACLDIGCGTGANTHELAVRSPSAQVYGIDLSSVPDMRPKLPNITYLQGNIMDETRFEMASFDLVFSSYLLLGMSDWPAYVNRCVSLLRPGGWVEMHDLSTAVHHVPLNVSSLVNLRPHTITTSQLISRNHPADKFQHRSPWLWETSLAKLLALKQADIYCGENIPFLFEQAGLVDISVKRYMIPFSRWEELTKEERALADWYTLFVRDLLPVCLQKAGEHTPEHTQEVKDAIEDAKRYYESYDGGRNFLWGYVVCGRKPEVPSIL